MKRSLLQLILLAVATGNTALNHEIRLLLGVVSRVGQKQVMTPDDRRALICCHARMQQLLRTERRDVHRYWWALVMDHELIATVTSGCRPELVILRALKEIRQDVIPRLTGLLAEDGTINPGHVTALRELVQRERDRCQKHAPTHADRDHLCSISFAWVTLSAKTPSSRPPQAEVRPRLFAVGASATATPLPC